MNQKDRTDIERFLNWVETTGKGTLRLSERHLAEVVTLYTRDDPYEQQADRPEHWPEHFSPLLYRLTIRAFDNVEDETLANRTMILAVLSGWFTDA